MRFIGMETLSSKMIGVRSLPLERFTVRMRREDGRWKLVDYGKEWLAPEGPAAPSGEEDLKQLPEHERFANPNR